MESLHKNGGHQAHRHGLDGDYSNWFSIAEQGLFAYDWDSTQELQLEPYWLVASPLVPVTLEELPAPVRQYIEAIRLDCDFGNDLNLKEHFDVFNEPNTR
jgi:hypothetical protein